MPMHNVMVLVDGREVVLPHDRLNGREVLAAVGADPDRRDVLIRDDGGRARLVAPADEIETEEGVAATFRVHRNGGLYHLKVDGRSWEWGAPGISEDCIRDIADIPEDVGLFLGNAGGEPIRRGALIDLSTDWVPQVVSRQVAPERSTVPVVINGRSLELATKEITYDDLVGLAFPNAGDGRDLLPANRLFTVTFRNGPADRPEGSVVPAQTLHAIRGTVINVSATDKS